MTETAKVELLNGNWTSLGVAANLAIFTKYGDDVSIAVIPSGGGDPIQSLAISGYSGEEYSGFRFLVSIIDLGTDEVWARCESNTEVCVVRGDARIIAVRS